jgi:uridine kinase
MEKGKQPFGKQPYIIGIAGGTASGITLIDKGKSSVSERIIKNLGVQRIALISMDSFYKCNFLFYVALTKEQINAAFDNNYNFDHPGICLLKRCFRLR